jgi:hypothetical protein
MAPPAKAPSVQLRITAINTSTSIGELKLTHNGGDALILKDQKITVSDAIDETQHYYVNAVTLNEFQNGAAVADTLGAGASIVHSWNATVGNEAPTKGTILKVMLQDIPSGQVITQMQITVV